MAASAAPPHLFGREAVRLILAGNGGTRILVGGRQMSAFGKRLWQQRCSLRARGQRGTTRNKSKGKFQKVAAFHDNSLSSWLASDARRVLAGRDERALNWAFR
jgi:hypothetical protein